MTPDQNINLVRIIGSLSMITIIAKIFGFIEKMVIAHYFGTSDNADIYFGVTALLLSLIFLVKELIYPTLLPILSQTWQTNRSEANHLFKKTSGLTALVLLFLALCMVLGSTHITHLCLSGFSPAAHQISSQLLRYLAPVIVLMGLMVLTTTALNAHRKFLVSILGELLVKILLVFGLVIFLPRIHLNALALSMALAGIAGLCFHLCFLPQRSCLMQRTQGNNQPFKKMLLLMSPLVIGVVFSHMSGLIDNLLASTLPSGRLASLSYAKKIIDALLLIGPVAVVTVIYSQIAHLAAHRDMDQLSQLISRTMRVLLYISVPLSCLIIFLRHPILRCLFQHGSFTAASTQQTATALMIYAFGFATFALESLLVYSFFALSDTKTPVVWGIVCVVLDIFLAWLWLDPFGELGIAAALVVTKTIKTLVLAYRLGKKLPNLYNAELIVFILKLFLATALLGITVKTLLALNQVDSLFETIILSLLLPGITGMIFFMGMSFLLRMDESRWLWVHCIKRFRLSSQS